MPVTCHGGRGIRLAHSNCSSVIGSEDLSLQVRKRVTKGKHLTGGCG